MTNTTQFLLGTLAGAVALGVVAWLCSEDSPFATHDAKPVADDLGADEEALTPED